MRKNKILIILFRITLLILTLVNLLIFADLLSDDISKASPVFVALLWVGLHFNLFKDQKSLKFLNGKNSIINLSFIILWTTSFFLALFA